MHLYIYLRAFIYIYDILINEMLQIKCFIKKPSVRFLGGGGGGGDESQFQGLGKFLKLT